MKTEKFRRAHVQSLTDAGWDASWAELASTVLQPLDDDTVASREFAGVMRRAARRVANLLRHKSQMESQSTIIAALGRYVEVAEGFGETHYVERYRTLERQLETMRVC